MAGFTLGPRARAAGYRIAGHAVIASTNTEAMARARAGEPGHLWVAALEQTAGRGRRGRRWVSPFGNLAASLLLRVEAGAPAATLGFVAGLALDAALGTLAPARFGVGLDGGATAGPGAGQGGFALKWPNDVLADGTKVAGILLEAEPQADGSTAVVIGFGVNVVAAPEGLPYPATSLRALGLDVPAEALAELLAESWVEAFGLWDGGRGLPLVRDRWLARAAGLGAPVAVSHGGRVLRGTFETIDGTGRLVLLGEDGARLAIAAGDVHFGATATLAETG